MLMKLTALETEFSGNFSLQIDVVKNIIGGLQLLIDAYRDEQAADDLGKLQAQRNRFQTWAENEINTAEGVYRAGEALASTWGYTRDSAAVQEHYANALLRLWCIHEGDLQDVNPGLYQRRAQLIRDIETHYHITKHVRDLRIKRGVVRISDK
jgi:hypothetical protein